MKLFKRSRNTKAEEHHQQQQQATRSTSAPLHEKHRADEYAYVPSRFGYDYAPPSLLAPSHSADSSTVQKHDLSKMLYAEEPVSELSGNTASMSSYYKKHVNDAVLEHKEYEAKYQKTPQVTNNNNSQQQLQQHMDWRIQKSGSGSRSHWRPSEKEQRQRLSEQQKKQRAEKFRELSTIHGGGPPPQPGFPEEREQAPHPYHHGGSEIRQPAERMPTLRDVPSVDSGLPFTRERSRQSRYSMGGSIASSQRSNNSRQRSQPSRYSVGDSVARSQRSNTQRKLQTRGIPQQSVASSQRSKERRQQPMQMPMPQHLVASHSMDASTITTKPDTFGIPDQGTYHRQHQASRSSSRSSSRPPTHDQHILSHQPSSKKGTESRTSARDRKRSIERNFNDFKMRERGWVPTELVRADIIQASKKNKIVNAAPSVTISPKNMETKTEEKRVPIAPVVPPKKGLIKRLFGRGKSKKTLKNGNKSQAASTGSKTKKRPPRIQLDPPSKGSIRGVNPARSDNSASTRAMSYGTDDGSRTKMYGQRKDNDTPVSMAAARSIASSHKKYGIKLARDSKDAGVQYNASAQSKGSSNKLPSQQQQYTTSSANRPTAPNQIFFPEATVGGSTSRGSSRHSADTSTKYYTTGGSTSQSRLSSHTGGSSESSSSAVRSSSFDRRQVQLGSFGSSKRSNASSNSRSKAVTNSMISSRSSGSRLSHHGLQTIRSGDSDWKTDPRMPDPWVKPRASNVIIRGNHRNGNSRPPHAGGASAISFFNFSCV